MTSPNGGVPSGGITGSGGMAAHAGTTEGQWRDSIYNQVNDSFGDVNLFGAILRNLLSTVLGFFSGFATVIDAIFGTVNDTYIRDLPIITDHSRSITEIREELAAATIHGNARVFTSNHTYYASPGTIEAFVIYIGAGGGGASGKWDLILATNRRGGCGGGGGGETHFLIPGTLLFDSNGDPKPIDIRIGEGGKGAVNTDSPGNGGGNTSIAGVIAGGGDGGARGTTTNGGGKGGIGVIRGGDGGSAVTTDNGTSTPGRDSLSTFGELYGGGGGGGAGVTGWAGGTNPVRPGGSGGVSPGGQLPGQNGTPPSPIVVTGGGGGSGGNDRGGDGAYPGGGGGGGGYGTSESNWGAGGNGADGIAYIIERRA